MNDKTRKLLVEGTVFTGIYIAIRAIARHYLETESIDVGNPYIGMVCEQCGSYKTLNCHKNRIASSVYESKVKPALDRFISFVGLIVLSPLMGVIALAVVIDDPGPIFFIQKRVGKDGKYFMLHKYRTMKMSTPHDVPTHMLSNPERYITRVGKVLRRTSLDELPQIWDIFRGKMSIIGPRPALWNQEDLIEERSKYGANDLFPGLTGLAQIHGRDELEISDKAALDGEYAKILKQGGIKALLFDVKMFCATIVSVIRHDGVIEGGTGSLTVSSDKLQNAWNRGVVVPIAEETGFEEYGHLKTFHIDKERKIRILITGSGSYIGDNFEKYVREYYPNISIDIIDMLDGTWRDCDFSRYDTIFHVAGIAHADTGSVSTKQQKKYYEVNTNLAIETAEKSKADGVSQFIFMSSMIVYGDSAPYGKEKIIDEYTRPVPANFYGDSKWRGDVGVRKLADDSFAVAVLRPPMVYGKGCKGNYSTLAKLAKCLPIFPNISNNRSMLYIENLCEFVSLLALSGEGGIYFPQNPTYTKTAEMVSIIGGKAHRPVKAVKLLNPVIALVSHVPGKIGALVNKAFGNCVYDQGLSQYKGLDYQKIGLEESIRRAEGADTVINFTDFYNRTADRKYEKQRDSNPLHILVISQYFYPETFRINDMAMEWVKRGYKVTVLTGIPNYPMGKFFDGYDYSHRRREKWKGMEIIRIPLIPRGSSSIGMVENYFSFVASGWWWKTVNDVKADLVFSYEVSPMTQALIGCWYSRKHHIPHFLYVQDLWPENVESVTGIHSSIIIKPIDKMVDWIYKNTDQIFTTSPGFAKSIVSRGVEKNKVHYWPQYAEEFYRPLNREIVRREAKSSSPVNIIPDDSSFKIAFTGNIGTAQGLDILPKVAERLKCSHNKVRFIIVGDGRYQEQFKAEIKKHDVGELFVMIPRQNAKEIPSILACCDAAFLSFKDMKLWEMTIPAKLQSYLACGMPIIAAASGETKRVIDEAKCGMCCPIGDIAALTNAIRSFAESTPDERKIMARNGKIYCETQYAKKLLMNDMDKYIRSVLRTEATDCLELAVR